MSACKVYRPLHLDRKLKTNEIFINLNFHVVYEERAVIANTISEIGNNMSISNVNIHAKVTEQSNILTIASYIGI
jgi:hypothetical protein